MSQHILLHACCAPCAGAVIESLKSGGESFAVFFSNSNISTPEEYYLRLSELRRYCDTLGVPLIEDAYDHSDWLQAISGLEDEPERGSRCAECFRYRLRRSAAYARLHGYTLLTTTLASSRWKNLDQVNSAGIQACSELITPAESSLAAPAPSATNPAAHTTLNSAASSSAQPLADSPSTNPALSAAQTTLTPAAHSATQSCPSPDTLQDSHSDPIPQFWCVNWRKGGLQERRAAIIREQQFYNQTYCGCEFSKR